MDHTPGFLDLVNDAKKRINEEDITAVKKRLDSPQKLVMIDVREDSEWARGHIPGAIHLGKGVIERDIERAIPDKSTQIVLYCGGGFSSSVAGGKHSEIGC